jgi:hypothetical protein
MLHFYGAAIMAKKAETGRYELKADREWLERAAKAAKKLGLSLAAYIRLVVTEDMDRRSRDEQPPRRK